MSSAEVENLLVGKFPAQEIKRAVRHYSSMVEDYVNEDWEDSIAKSGKFVEATLKALAKHCKIALSTGRTFKVDNVINALAGLKNGAFDDSLRLAIPRASRFVYDVASNRGGRHDPDEIDPNHMDANVVVTVCAWILAEMIRCAQKGVIDSDQAKFVVETLTAKKYPFLEEIDGRVYVHMKNSSARDVALVLLARQHPERISKEDLVALLVTNGFSKANARMAMTRIKNVVDVDEENQLWLLAPGLKKAEDLIKESVEASLAKT